MLKFFRTIRKKLIEQDNVRKYLIYAIGEILLVVIGILIALQINNWNQERNLQKEERHYLAALRTDFGVSSPFWPGPLAACRVTASSECSARPSLMSRLEFR
jgi:hypothetical protein